jgi:hypothetical protein
MARWYQKDIALRLGISIYNDNGLLLGVEYSNEKNKPILCGYFNEQLEWAIPPQYLRGSDFVKNGNATVTTLNGDIGLINSKGDLVIKTPINTKDYYLLTQFNQYNLMEAYKEEYHRVGHISTRLGGYINTNNEWAVEPKYAPTEFGRFSENGLAFAKTIDQKLYGYINIRGEFVIGAQFSRAFSFHQNGLAVAKSPDNNLWGFIDSYGTWVVRPQFDLRPILYPTIAEGMVSLWVNDLLVVPAQDDESNYLDGVVNIQGSWVIRPEFKAITLIDHSGRTLVVATTDQGTPNNGRPRLLACQTRIEADIRAYFP